MFQKFIAQQLAHPSGPFGRWVVSRWLDRDNMMMNQVTLERLNILANDKVLEVGFGSGYLLEKILSSTSCSYAAGVDPSKAMVRLVRRRLRKYIESKRVDVRTGSIDALPYHDGEFTKLCTVNTLYFWQDPDVALLECKRILQMGGLFVICFNAKEEMEHWDIHQYGFRLYDLAEVESLLLKTGFSAIDIFTTNDPSQGLFYCVNAQNIT